MQFTFHTIYQVSNCSIHQTIQLKELSIIVVILQNTFIFSGLETLQMNRRHSMFFHNVNLNEMVMCLEDLINYFCQPDEDMGELLAKYLIIYLLTL